MNDKISHKVGHEVTPYWTPKGGLFFIAERCPSTTLGLTLTDWVMGLLLFGWFWGVSRPGNIEGHISTDRLVTVCTNYDFIVLPHWEMNLISHWFTLSWHWANQSLSYPNIAKHLPRKRQVSIFKSLVWLDGGFESHYLSSSFGHPIWFGFVVVLYPGNIHGLISTGADLRHYALKCDFIVLWHRRTEPSSTMTLYPTQSHYLHIEPTRPRPILLNAVCQALSRQVIGLTWPGFKCWGGILRKLLSI